MSGGFRRSLADCACRLLQAVLPPPLQSWGWAIRCETAGIPDDGKALLFAVSSLCGLMPRAVASHLLHPFASLIGDGAIHTGGSVIVNVCNAMLPHSRALGIVCATGAVSLGVVYMTIAGAPMRYVAINVGALVIGLAALALLGRSTIAGHQWNSASIATMAGTLLATALLGSEVDGATRWVNLGGLSVQPSLILMPLMLVTFVRVRDALSTIGIIVAAVAVALQPDRAMAGTLAVGLAVLTIMRPEKHVVVASVASAAGFVATLARADTLPAVPYVDQVLYSSFDVHAAAGMAVLGGSTLLLVPAIVGLGRDAENRATYANFGAVWFAAIAAAALGNYPTPIVGYGGSAIIGYVLSLLALPKLSGVYAGGTASAARREANRTPVDPHLLVGLA